MTAHILSPENSQGLSPEHSSPCIVSGPLPDRVLSHFMVRRPPTLRTSSVSHQHSNTNNTTESDIQSPSSIPLSVDNMTRLPPTPEQSPASESTEEEVMDEAGNETFQCEFSRPCVTGNHNPRKCISHFFGRNKTCTRGFPDHVWVWYCRKHYQRARYRAESWPFEQCDIFQQTLDRMEAWGGVSSFKLTLRKREHIRTPSADTDVSVSSAHVNRTRRSTSIQSQRSSSGGLRNSRKGRNMSAPVPLWLRSEVGDNKSFDEIRNIIDRIREHIHAEQEAHNKVAFPDIEILPRFNPEFFDETGDNDSNVSTSRLQSKKKGARRDKRATSNTRVNRKGAVKKIGAKA
ncbi:hypothetical protein VTN77DRAFT_2010 [Rasamsonia byssochlamydoides]|uniref:uncharacterized protein n=1 Tax=Rasamsonia byssochlamydoides TaxID=89139 RepID=UPI003743DE18